MVNGMTKPRCKSYVGCVNSSNYCAWLRRRCAVARANRWEIQHWWHISVKEGDLTVGLRSKSKYYRFNAEFYCDDNSIERVGMATKWTFWNFCLKMGHIALLV